jgi:hypothetical protein
MVSIVRHGGGGPEKSRQRTNRVLSARPKLHWQFGYSCRVAVGVTELPEERMSATAVPFLRQAAQRRPLIRSTAAPLYRSPLA